jgi:lipopolysaccharide cholinephosphotransferase
MKDVQAGREPGSDDSSMPGDLQDQVPNHDLRDLQLVELSILREFVRVCEAHELRYYLAYGTLLGAVRHRGFIPWDDDIDVTMPRDDYNRFAKICASDLRPGFEWQSYATEEHYPHWFGKVIKTDTVFRQELTERLSFRQSVYIDVFPLDGLADRPWEALGQRVLFRICRLRLGVDVKRTPVKHLLVQVVRVLPRRSAISLIEAMSRRFPIGTSRRWICVGGPYGHRRQSVQSRWFGMGAVQAFHDLRVVGPAAWDEYLTHLYGDYMVPPPPLLRMTDHLVTELQLEPESVADMTPETGIGRYDKAHVDTDLETSH